MGKRIGEGKNDPLEDILFLENEIDLWFKQIIERQDWNKFLKSFLRQKGKIVDELYNRLSGVKVKKIDILKAIQISGLDKKNPSSWTEDDVLNFSKKLREFSKPILIVANKIDKEISKENFEKLKERYKGALIPCSSLAEYYLRKYEKERIIDYIPGSNDFSILQPEKLTQKELEALHNIKEKILNYYGSTGVQDALNFAVFNLAKQICVYPVADLNTYSDNNNNVLPDAILIDEGTKLKEFVKEKIHSDLAKKFMFGIDARTKKRLSEDYELKNNDVIKVVVSK